MNNLILSTSDIGDLSHVSVSCRSSVNWPLIEFVLKRIIIASKRSQRTMVFSLESVPY